MDKISFSLDTNTIDFTDIFKFADISQCTEDEKHVRIVNSDMRNDAALSVVYKHLSSIVDITDEFKNIKSSLLDATKLTLSASSVFSLPNGFEVHHCPVLANGENNIGTRSNYKPDRIQQNNISAMYSQMIQPESDFTTEKTLTDITQFYILRDLLDATTLSVGINAIIPTKGDEYPVIDSSSIMTLFLEFASILEKLKYLQCNVYFKQTAFDGMMLFHNTINVYPELPATTDNRGNCFYSAVLASPMSKYYFVDMTKSSFLKEKASTTTAAPVNQIALGRLIYVGTDYVDYSTFQLDTFDGTNGKAEIFANITTSTYDIKSQIPDIISMFKLSSGNLIKLKNVRQAILYIFDLWQRNIQSFQIDIYSCHYNCHLNNFAKVDVDDSLIVEYYYRINHVIDKTTFPKDSTNIRNLIDIKDQSTSYYFSSSRDIQKRKAEAEGKSTETEKYYDATGDRIPIQMRYPFYSGDDPNVVVPLSVECKVTNIYPSSDDSDNSKIINLTSIYYLTKKSDNVVDLSVQDQGYDSDGKLVRGIDTVGLITVGGFEDVGNIISCVGDITFTFKYASGGITKEYFLETGNIKNVVNKDNDYKINDGYIYDVNLNTDLYTQPDYINMTYRDSAHDYRYKYTPTAEGGDIQIFYHYDTNPKDISNPDFYTRLSNYIRITYKDGIAVDSEQIPDEEAFDPGTTTLKDGVFRQFQYTYENSTHVTENAKVTIIPIAESKFGGSLDVFYQIKQLRKLSFADKNIITSEWDPLTQQDIGDYTQGNGPFTPIPLLYEIDEYGNWKQISEDMYSVTYENNNPTTTVEQIMKTIVSPSKISEGKYGESFYGGEPLVLTCKLQPMTEESIGSIGDYQGNLTGTSGIQKYTEDSWWKHGSILDWNGEQLNSNYTFGIEPRDQGGWKISKKGEGSEADDKNAYRAKEWEHTTTLPADVKRITIKIMVGSPWDTGGSYSDGATCFGFFSFEIQGLTLAVDIYSKKLRDYMKTQKGSNVTKYEKTFTMTVPALEDGETNATLISHSYLMDPHIENPRFISISLWYESELVRNFEKAKATINSHKISIVVESHFDTSLKLADEDALASWKSQDDSSKTYSCKSIAYNNKNQIDAKSLFNCNSTSKTISWNFTDNFSSMTRPYVMYVKHTVNSRGKIVEKNTKYYVQGWNIIVECSDSSMAQTGKILYNKPGNDQTGTGLNKSSCTITNKWYDDVILTYANNITKITKIRLIPRVE